MGKASANSIDKLLLERAQFMSWLARLDSTGDAVPSVPEGVRTKVRADYEARLQHVLEELRAHSATIAEQLDEFRARRQELLHREGQAKEQMAEAEVRHAVGEYDEPKWQGIRGEATRVLVSVREELGRTTAEIDRLTEVQTLLAAPVPQPEPHPAPPPAAPPAAEAPRPAARPTAPAPAAPAAKAPASLEGFLIMPPEFESSAPHATPPTVETGPAVPESPVAPAAPKAASFQRKPPAAPKAPAPGPKEETPGRTEWIPSDQPAPPPAKLDELAFLKSVSNEKSSSGTRRTSGSFARTEEPAPPAPPPARPSKVPPISGIQTADPFASKSRPSIGDSSTRSTSGSTPAAKTLKCGECGTLNRPTEWYCERCGAELAAL